MADQLMEEPSKRTHDLHYQRARRSWRSRFVSDYRHWIRRTFSRESYINSLKALLWVVPLSALIWSYAFNEQLEKTGAITVNLALAQNADQVVRFADEKHAVLATLKGPQKDIAPIEDYLRANSLKLDVDRSLGSGRHQIDVSSALSHDRRVAAAGMTVELCDPQTIMVDVDEIISVPVEVKLRPDEAAGIRATFTPARVKLLGPKRDMDAAAPTVIYANPKSYTQYLSQKEVARIPAVALEIPPGLDATTSPSTVSAEIEVTGDAEETMELPTISVLKTMPFQDGSEGAKVVYEPRLSGIKIRGPKAAIELVRRRIASADIEQPYAEFTVNFDKHTAALRFQNLPEGVRVVEEPGKPHTIDYTLEPRTN